MVIKVNGIPREITVTEEIAHKATPVGKLRNPTVIMSNEFLNNDVKANPIRKSRK